MNAQLFDALFTQRRNVKGGYLFHFTFARPHRGMASFTQSQKQQICVQMGLNINLVKEFANLFIIDFSSTRSVCIVGLVIARGHLHSKR